MTLSNTFERVVDALESVGEFVDHTCRPQVPSPECWRMSRLRRHLEGRHRHLLRGLGGSSGVVADTFDIFADISGRIADTSASVSELV